MKYEWKIEKEFEKKKKQLDKKKADKLHNLKIEVKIDNRERKPRVKNTAKTDYANACDLSQLKSKLVGTDEFWYWECICCPWSYYDWDELDGWHYIPKGKSRATSLDDRNIHPQSKACNSSRWWWGRFDAQTQQIEKRHGEWTVADLLRIKNAKPKIYPVEYIKENLPIVRWLLAKKKFPKELMDKYVAWIDKLEKRYNK